MAELGSRCELLRSLHVPGDPVVLPNAWDVASAKAIEAAGFPAVATTSGGVAAALGYEDHEGAPGDEMLAAAARIGRKVSIPVTVDAEAGYGMEPEELVAALSRIGAAGCNLEDTNHATGNLRDPAEQAAWLRRIREAAQDLGYGLVINARIDVFVSALASGSDHGKQGELVSEALTRAHAYSEAGADCVYPILLWQAEAVRTFTSQALGPVNILAIPPAPSHAELAELGVARISYGSLLHRELMEHLSGLLEPLAADPAQRGENRATGRGHLGVTAEFQIEELKRADTGFFEALVDGDIPALEALLAEDFLIVDVASGSVHPRAAFLDAIDGRMVTFREIKTFPDDTVIRLAGPGTGIVIGRTAMSLSDAEGALTEVASRYTHVFQTDGRGWQLVSAQGTPISST
jgi:2-methylisocitrate lyase-like PEP mutase family enzyme